MARSVVLINGLPGSGKTTLAHALTAATGWPCVSKDAVKEALATVMEDRLPSGRLGAIAMDTVWSLAAAVAGVVLVDSWWFAPRDRDLAAAGARRAGASLVLEVWCEAGRAEARRRYAGRERAAVHADASRLDADWEHWADHAAPLGLGPVLRVSTCRHVDVTEVARWAAGLLRP